MLDVNVTKRLGADPSAFFLDVSFSVDGGITVLAGASGAGKTTTLRSIAGIVTPDEGNIKVGDEIYFDSKQHIDLSIQERRVGFVFQDYALFPHLTAEQNIAYGIKTKSKTKKAEKAIEMLRLFHIEHIGNRVPREMSGGEQQRVAVARALASDPAVLLLDEPLSAVDVETRSKLLDEIEAVQAQTGIPFVYVTHNEVEAVRLGRQRVTLENGRVVMT
ncbi:MAG TPA: ATP-binding cassette domain-containing protein [Pyrinomonadaceae bacterium]|nr:ATP-binding cassette domain-containing protein [Pyrinomonadaceae bacterium]